MTVPAITADASGLAETVERARALLDEGDVIAARMLAGGAYDAAKAAAAFGSRFGAAERLVRKARRLQGDALLIEARAKIRLADDWNAAQEAGAASKGGRPKTVADENGFTAEQAGITRQEIFEARKLAAAELRAPGIVERAIAARLAAGLEPSRANLRAAVGTASTTKQERGNNLYETPIEAMRVLLALERFSPVIWEPACGRGAILRVLEDAGYTVRPSDLVDYGTADREGECQAVIDFLETEADFASGALNGGDAACPDIVTNPPYGADLNRFVAHALRVHRPRKLALLLNLNFLCGFDDADRRFAMDECQPSRTLIFTRRLPMMHRDGWDGPEAASRMNTAWFIWERDAAGGYPGPNIARRVDWKDFAEVPALGPREESPTPAPPRKGEGEVADSADALSSIEERIARENPSRPKRQRKAAS